MKARIPEPVLTPEEEQKQEAADEKNNRSYLNYAHRNLLMAAHTVLGYGGERMRRSMRCEVM